MSIEKNREEGLRWLKTAENDLEAAAILKKSGKYSLACFHAQQAAEKAIKSLYYALDKETWGHSIFKLFQGLQKEYPGFKDKKLKLDTKAKRLDQFYISTRYPNGLPDITPEEAFGDEDATISIAYAKVFIDVVRKYYKKK
jgi:HEPN domain-containing protein